MELVKIENKQVVVSSRDVANRFKREHKNVLKTIENILAANLSATKFFYKTVYKNRGKEYPEYLMNRDGFSLLVMGFNGNDALEWKIKYIQAFNKMEKQIQEIINARVKSIGVRNALTNTIRDKIPETPNKRFAYPNYTKLIYKRLFGLTSKQLREKYGLSKDGNIRDCFDKDELQDVTNAEFLVSGLINCGWGYKQIKEFINNNVRTIEESNE
jgi:Rha family phage regulatory protein